MPAAARGIPNPRRRWLAAVHSRTTPYVIAPLPGKPEFRPFYTRCQEANHVAEQVPLDNPQPQRVSNPIGPATILRTAILSRRRPPMVKSWTVGATIVRETPRLLTISTSPRNRFKRLPDQNSCTLCCVLRPLVRVTNRFLIAAAPLACMAPNINSASGRNRSNSAPNCSVSISLRTPINQPGASFCCRKTSCILVPSILPVSDAASLRWTGCWAAAPVDRIALWAAQVSLPPA